MTLFSATIEGFVLIPKVRTTQVGKWSPRARQQLKNQAALAWEMKKCWNGHDPIDYPVEISFSVHLPHKRRVDADNLLKSICDAIQYAGIVKNDSVIKGIGKSRIFHDRKARVVVSLRRL